LSVSDEKLVAIGLAIASPSGFVLVPAAMFPSKQHFHLHWGVHEVEPVEMRQLLDLAHLLD
jgi:hypothetical protein